MRMQLFRRISFGANDTLFLNAIRIKVENKIELSDFNWGFETLGTLL